MFFSVAAAGPVFGPFLGPVSPVCDFVQRWTVPLYLPADGGVASDRDTAIERMDRPCSKAIAISSRSAREIWV
jgi:hypothetical protein